MGSKLLQSHQQASNQRNKLIFRLNKRQVPIFRQVPTFIQPWIITVLKIPEYRDWILRTAGTFWRHRGTPIDPWIKALAEADADNRQPLIDLLRSHAKPDRVPPAEIMAEVNFHLADLLDRRPFKRKRGEQQTPSYEVWSPSMQRMIFALFAMWINISWRGMDKEDAAERVARELDCEGITQESLIEFAERWSSQFWREKKRQYS
jgi:hypothetical protein